MTAKVYVSELPGCDFGAHGERARFDFRTKSGAWANGCYQCWRQNRATYGLGAFSLGTGVGQLLLTPGETAGDIIVSMVRRACPSPGAARELLYQEFGELVFERKAANDKSESAGITD